MFSTYFLNFSKNQWPLLVLSDGQPVSDNDALFDTILAPMPSLTPSSRESGLLLAKQIILVNAFYAMNIGHRLCYFSHNKQQSFVQEHHGRGIFDPDKI